MVSEFQKKKKNACGVYVDERCKQTGVPFCRGFETFGHEWNALSEEIKETYKGKAKQYNEWLKAEMEVLTRKSINKPINDEELAARSNWVRQIPIRNTESTSNGIRKRPASYLQEIEDGEECNSEEYSNAEIGPKSEPTPPQAPPLKKTVYIGDDKADAIWFEQEEIGEPQLDFDEADMSEPESLWYNATGSYFDIENLMEQPVFVFHAIPVVYAQGYKKGGNKAINRPLEVAVSVFSLKNGMEKTFFRAFVDPGNILAINEQAAEESRKERHGIPHSSNLLYTDSETTKFFHRGFCLNSNYYDIYHTLLQVCGFDGQNEEDLLPLFVSAGHVASTEACFRWLVSEADKEAVTKGLKVLPGLKFATLEDYAKIAIHLRTQDINQSILNYGADYIKRSLKYDHVFKQFPVLSCEFHQRHAAYKECALAATKQAIYMLLKLLDSIFNFPEDERFVFLGQQNNDENADEENEEPFDD